MSVPDHAMWSPTSNGACWRGSGSPAARVVTPGMTNIPQNSLPAGGWVSSPLAGNGTTPASVKLRQWRPAPAGLGRLACGHSGASALAGSGRGGPLRGPGAGVVGARRVGAWDAHRVAGAGVDRRVLVVDAEARVGALLAAEAAVGVVDLEHGRVRRIAGVDMDAAGVVVDLRDDAAAGVRRLLGGEHQPGDVLAVDDVADRAHLERRVAGAELERGAAVDHVGPRQRVGGHLHDEVAGNGDLRVVDRHAAAPELLVGDVGTGAVVGAHRRVLDEAGLVEAVDEGGRDGEDGIGERRHRIRRHDALRRWLGGTAAAALGVRDDGAGREDEEADEPQRRDAAAACPAERLAAHACLLAARSTGAWLGDLLVCTGAA